MRKARTINTDNYILSLSQFVERIECMDIFDSTSTFIYRGQEVEGNLLPSVSRHNPKINTSEREEEDLELIQKMGAAFLDDSGNSELDLMVLTQHFGLKTRLLDWSTNPLVALWFACSGSSKGDTYVYVLKADEFMRKDIYKSNPFELRKTGVVMPRMNNERVVAQHGCFTLHRYSIKDGRFVALEKNSEIKGSIEEIVISEKSRKDILFSLNRYGINNKTLFPDLEGLCKHINWTRKNS